ncbi:hypothetical protein QDX21_04890 [Auritidibacter ignavus]|uniref:Uncharacterized protein n=1 Tax=Auritidibacter ignavus TaxID=678932 RepID=A0AAJ6AIY1_9MICC|nr:hypothetical protein [Auritidibacter ignavus]WGH94130.1 hypothetical protein QDX21_04890 [Auritidibacter ignavus]
MSTGGRTALLWGGSAVALAAVIIGLGMLWVNLSGGSDEVELSPPISVNQTPTSSQHRPSQAVADESSGPVPATSSKITGSSQNPSSEAQPTETPGNTEVNEASPKNVGPPAPSPYQPDDDDEDDEGGDDDDDDEDGDDEDDDDDD